MDTTATSAIGGEFGSVVTRGQKESIIIGQTTKTQILRELGNPDQTIDLGNNMEQLSYIKERVESKGGASGVVTTSTYTEFWIILENGIVIDKGERPTTKQPNYFK